MIWTSCKIPKDWDVITLYTNKKLKGLRQLKTTLAIVESSEKWSNTPFLFHFYFVLVPSYCPVVFYLWYAWRSLLDLIRFSHCNILHALKIDSLPNSSPQRPLALIPHSWVRQVTTKDCGIHHLPSDPWPPISFYWPLSSHGGVTQVEVQVNSPTE